MPKWSELNFLRPCQQLCNVGVRHRFELHASVNMLACSWWQCWSSNSMFTMFVWHVSIYRWAMMINQLYHVVQYLVGGRDELAERWANIAIFGALPRVTQRNGVQLCLIPSHGNFCPPSGSTMNCYHICVRKSIVGFLNISLTLLT